MAIYTIGGATKTNPSGVPYQGVAWRGEREPDFHVYLYNISARSWEGSADPTTVPDQRVGSIRLTIPGVRPDDPTEVAEGAPPDNTKQLGKLVDLATGKPLKTKAGDPNQRYRFVTSFPQPILIPKLNEDGNELSSYEQDAIRFVVDLINPNNLGRTLTAGNAPGLASEGVDLSQKGVFFSLANPPFERDVQEAYARMNKYYAALFEKAQTLETADKAGLARELGSNPDYAYAATFFGKPVNWHRAPQRSIECVNCGEQKPAGRLFHPASGGLFICVEPTQEAWKAAVNAGAKEYDKVPEELKWREEKKAKSDSAK
jgi:hypothetical protein